MTRSVPGRDPVRAIVAALEPLTGPATLVAEHSRPWASATFVGERHRLTIDTVALDADALAEALIDFDIPLRRGFVADATIVSRERHPTGWRFGLELLTIMAD